MLKNIPLINKILIPVLLVLNIYGVYFYKTSYNIEKEELEASQREYTGLRQLTDEELAALRKSIRIDINTATYEDLITLSGIGPATANAIIEHRQTQGPFEYINDLERVRGIGSSLIENIKDKVKTLKEGMRETFEDEVILVNLLTASRDEIMKIPGIGAVTADAIINFRQSRSGRITTLNDFSEIRGMTDSFLKEISQYVSHPKYDDAPPPPRFPINVNRATREELMQVPGIGPAIADGIIAYRGRGRIRNLEELLNVNRVGPATLERLKPYLTVR